MEADLLQRHLKGAAERIALLHLKGWGLGGGSCRGKFVYTDLFNMTAVLDTLLH